MKRYYTAPEAEIERFTIVDTIATSPVHGGVIEGEETTILDDPDPEF